MTIAGTTYSINYLTQRGYLKTTAEMKDSLKDRKDEAKERLEEVREKYGRGFKGKDKD